MFFMTTGPLSISALCYNTGVVRMRHARKEAGRVDLRPSLGKFWEALGYKNIL